MNAYLSGYIDSHDALYSVTNGVAYVIFVASVFVLSRKWGIVQDGSKIHFPNTIVLVISMLFCIATFGSNILNQGSIATFYSDTYRRELLEVAKTHHREPTKKLEFTFCRYQTSDPAQETPVECFQRLREEQLIWSGRVSLACMGLTILCFMGAFLAVICKGVRHED